MTIPPILQKNDSVGIIAPARFLEDEKLQPSINWLKNLGLNPVISNLVSKKHHQFAGTDNQRITELQNFINNPNIKAIWCARGGYGTARLLDFIDFSPLKKNPKWIIGYSDITALHLHLQSLGVASLHATMPVNFLENSEENLQYLSNFLFGKTLTYQWENNFSTKNKNIEGEIIGGNLSVIYSLLGSTSSISTNNKILLLEDLDEYLYHIDRMFLNLKRNGLLSNLKALLIGGFTNMHDNAIPFGYSCAEIIQKYCQNFSYPIIFNTPSGHIRDNRPFVFGKTVKIQIQGKKITCYQ